MLTSETETPLMLSRWDHQRSNDYYMWVAEPELVMLVYNIFENADGALHFWHETAAAGRFS